MALILPACIQSTHYITCTCTHTHTHTHIHIQIYTCVYSPLGCWDSQISEQYKVLGSKGNRWWVGFAVQMKEVSLDWWGWRVSVCEEGFVVQGRRLCHDSEGQTLACAWMCSQNGWNLRSEKVIARVKAHASAIQRPRRWAWEYGPFSSAVQWASPNCASKSSAWPGWQRDALRQSDSHSEEEVVKGDMWRYGQALGGDIS